MMQTPQYNLRADEPTCVFEIYLPNILGIDKQMSSILQDAMYINKIKDHFVLHKEQIRTFVTVQGDQPHAHFDEAVTDIKRVYLGYSSYEVDGMFLGKLTSKCDDTTEDKDEYWRQMSSRSTVYRIIFRYDCADDVSSTNSDRRDIDLYRVALRRPPFRTSGEFRISNPLYFGLADKDIDPCREKVNN